MDNPIITKFSKLKREIDATEAKERTLIEKLKIFPNLLHIILCRSDFMSHRQVNFVNNGWTSASILHKKLDFWALPVYILSFAWLERRNRCGKLSHILWCIDTDTNIGTFTRNRDATLQFWKSNGYGYGCPISIMLPHNFSISQWAFS